MRYGLVGHPIPDLFSPQLHRALNGLSYELFDVSEKELLPLLRRRDIGGLDLAHPYRKLALSYCDKVSETAQKCGCVNTVVLGQESERLRLQHRLYRLFGAGEGKRDPLCWPQSADLWNWNHFSDCCTCRSVAGSGMGHPCKPHEGSHL